MYTNYDPNCCQQSNPSNSCCTYLPTYCCPTVTYCPCPTPCRAARRFSRIEPKGRIFSYKMSTPAKDKLTNDKNDKLKKKAKKGSLRNSSSSHSTNYNANNSSNNVSNNASHMATNNTSNIVSNTPSNSSSSKALASTSKKSSINSTNISSNCFNNLEYNIEKCKTAGMSKSLSSISCPSPESIRPLEDSFPCECKCSCQNPDYFFSSKQNNIDYKYCANSGKSASEASFDRAIMYLKGASYSDVSSRQQQYIDSFNNRKIRNESPAMQKKSKVGSQSSKQTPDKSNNLSRHISPQNKLVNFTTKKNCPQLDVIDEEDSEEEYRGTQQQEYSGSSRTLMQKSLEDSCADFLNIVCDNILESVQKSVDSKLKEFNMQAAEKFQILGKKLERNETAMLCLCTDVLKKITEQNKSNFEEFYSIIQDLVGSQAQLRKSESFEAESQSGTLLEDDVVNRSKVLSGLKKVANDRTTGGGGGSAAGNSAAVELNDKENKSLRQTGSILQILEEPEQSASKKSTQESPSLNGYSYKEMTEDQKYLPPSFTTFSLTPTGKTVFNCQFNNSDETKLDSKDNDKDSTVNVNKNNFYDNYDTSGYATEPEDNIEEGAISHNRKKFQKKSSKQHNNNNVSVHDFPNVSKRHNNDARSSSPTRLSRL